MENVKKIEGKPLKRIEGKVHALSGKARLRLSRTGGLNFGIHPFKGITFNTKHGARVSKTFRGLTAGLQGGKGFFRGRWSFAGGALNTNLSKSGLSFSTSTKHGTYNWMRPNRSSFKFAGLQIRGKKAAGPALVLAIFAIIPALISFAFQLLRITGHLILSVISAFRWLTRVLFVGMMVLWNFALFFIWDLPLQVLNISLGKTFVDVSAESETGPDPQMVSSGPKTGCIEIGNHTTLLKYEIAKLELQIENLTGTEEAPGPLQIVVRWLAFVAGLLGAMATLLTVILGVNYLQPIEIGAEFLVFSAVSLVLGVISFMLTRLGLRQVKLHRAQRKVALLKEFEID